jgi:hypothetical protein
MVSDLRVMAIRNLIGLLNQEIMAFIRLHLNKVKGENSLVITHEHGVLIIFLGLDSSTLILVKFS